jgi:hypothetical protein
MRFSDRMDNCPREMQSALQLATNLRAEIRRAAIESTW